MSAFAVFGNPIKHSKSAEIYKLFAQKINIVAKYDLRLVLEESSFEDIIFKFFKLKGLGANITVPFKERAFYLCNQLTDRAKLARSVNTIKKQHNGTLLGDNTDGIGFISDLKRLHWINNNHFMIVEKKELLQTIDILLIGAGGATKGIIPELLNIKRCHVNVVNRTYPRAQTLINYYYNMGFSNISCMTVNELFNDRKEYALIVNATTSSMYQDIPKIPSFLVTPFTKCYDLFYQKEDTAFLIWCKQYGAVCCADGLGMLVEQAAHAFYLWHDILPNTLSVISYLRSIL